MIDSLDDSSSCAFAVSTAARSASTRRRTARLARTGSIVGDGVPLAPL